MMSGLMNAYRRWRDSRPLRVYARKLPSLLVTRYGFQSSYFPARVRTTICEFKLSTSLWPYAAAMFGTYQEFAAELTRDEPVLTATIALDAFKKEGETAREYYRRLRREAAIANRDRGDFLPKKRDYPSNVSHESFVDVSDAQ